MLLGGVFWAPLVNQMHVQDKWRLSDLSYPANELKFALYWKHPQNSSQDLPARV